MSKTSYKYSSIKEIETAGNYNFYGIIYDSTFPSIDDISKNYSVNVKIIDPDINCLSYPNSLNEHIVTLIIKSNTLDKLPYIHNIGDIIRIHRGYYQIKKKKVIYVNLESHQHKIGSAFCIFSGASDISSKDYTPIAASSSNYTFENQDKQKIEYLRSFIRIHFKERNSLSYDMEIKLKDRFESKSDADVLLQIVHKTEMEDKVVLFVQDETDSCELHAFKYFNFLNVNDIIRLRSFKVFDK